MIEIKNLTVRYGAFPVLSLPGLTVPEKGFFLIAGDNGTGKTTLARCLLGIHRDFDGQITVDSLNPHSASVRELARILSYLPQNSQPEIDIPVRDFILQGLYSFPEIPATDSLLDSITAGLHISGLLDKNYNTLSGGQKQLARIARSLVAPVKYSLLDEPDSFLSRANRARFFDLAQSLSQTRSVILISHAELPEAVSLLELWEE